MSQARPSRMTFDEFLDWERRQERRHEFVDGVPVAMAGGSEAHNTIQTNLIAAIAPRLRGTPCRVFPSDMLVRTGLGRGRYSDMTIDCGPRRGDNRVAPQPTVVFEVLSRESQRDDRTLKLADYNATPSIAHYVMIEQQEMLAFVYSREPHGDFNLRPAQVAGAEGVIDLPAVGLTVALADLYEGLDGLAAG